MPKEHLCREIFNLLGTDTKHLMCFLKKKKRTGLKLGITVVEVISELPEFYFENDLPKVYVFSELKGGFLVLKKALPALYENHLSPSLPSCHFPLYVPIEHMMGMLNVA